MDTKPHPKAITDPAVTATAGATRSLTDSDPDPLKRTLSRSLSHAHSHAHSHSLSKSLSRSATKKSLDKLEADIIGLSQHINASEYEFLVLLREFERRQG